MSTPDFTINKKWFKEPKIKLALKFLFFQLKNIYDSEQMNGVGMQQDNKT